MDTTNVPERLQSAFKLQAEGKIDEAYHSFLDGISDLCWQEANDGISHALGLLPEIKDQQTRIAVTKMIGNHLANKDLERAQSYLSTFPTPEQNDAWYLEVLHVETPAEEKNSNEFINKIIAIKSQWVRDQEITSKLMLPGSYPPDRQNDLLQAISNPTVRAHMTELLEKSHE